MFLVAIFVCTLSLAFRPLCLDFFVITPRCPQALIFSYGLFHTHLLSISHSCNSMSHQSSLYLRYLVLLTPCHILAVTPISYGLCYLVPCLSAHLPVLVGFFSSFVFLVKFMIFQLSHIFGLIYIKTSLVICLFKNRCGLHWIVHILFPPHCEHGQFLLQEMLRCSS